MSRRSVDKRTLYGGLWRRFSALSIDCLLFAALFFPATRIAKGAWLMTPSDHRWANGVFITDPLCIAYLVTMLAYFTVLESTFGMTVGKWAMGLRVVGSDDHGRPGLRRALFRNLLRLVDGLPAFNIVGVALILGSEERARFGDRYAGTRVITSHFTNISSTVRQTPP